MRSRWGDGKVYLGQYSSLRKRMRAIRRGKIEPWWPSTEAAEKRMLERYGLWHAKQQLK